MKNKKLIMLFNQNCSHCRSVFRYFMRKNIPKVQEGMDMDIKEYKKFIKILKDNGENFKKAYKIYSTSSKNPISVEGIENIESIALYLLPVESSTSAGRSLAKELLAFSKVDVVYDSVRYPSWLDFKTHEVYSTGHHSKHQLLDMLDEQKIASRRDKFKKYYSEVMKKDCDAVACGMKQQIKKINVDDIKMVKNNG